LQKNHNKILSNDSINIKDNILEKIPLVCLILMNVGVIGLGKMGILHSAILNTINDVNLVAVTEKEKKLTEIFQKAVPNISVYQEYKQMFEKEKLDLVYITTPSFTHFPIINSCIKNKLNFFVEKPLTIDFNQAKKICEQLENSEIYSAVGYNLRFLGTFEKAKSLIENNCIGQIHKVKATMFVSNIFSRPSGWRFKKSLSGGGVLLEFGCHLVDLLLYYFGRIKSVSGNTKSVYSEVEDFANMNLEFQNGVNCELKTSWSVKGYRIPETNIEIYGEGSSMKVNQDFIEIFTDKNRTYEKIYHQELNRPVSFDVGGIEYTKEDEYFIKTIKEKKQAMVNVFEAAKTQAVIDTMYLTSKTGKTEQVDYEKI